MLQVLNDERLEEAIKLTALESVSNDGCSEKEALTKAKDRAKTILLEMESRISNVLLKMIAWLLYKLLPCFIQSAIVLPSQIEMLKKANETGLPLIFLPLHRSHLDYIMISFTLLINNVRNPLIAAGDNLKIPLLGYVRRLYISSHSNLFYQPPVLLLIQSFVHQIGGFYEV